MALFFADLVREASWGAGAGDLSLAGPLPGHRDFAGAVPVGARFHYAIRGVTHPDEWETGEGELDQGKLARTPLASSSHGAAVPFSAGLKTVALTVNADWFAARDGGVTSIDDVAGLAEALAGKAPTGHAHSFGNLTGKPTTLSGYGITDAAGSGHGHEGVYQPVDADLSAIAAQGTSIFGRAQLALADAAALRGHAGLGALSVQAPDSVAITGGNISGIVDLAVADGGTGASSAPAARSNLGLGSIATQAAADVSITGGAISGLSSLSVTGAGAFGGHATVKGDVYVWGGNAAPSGGITANAAGGGLYIYASGVNQNIRLVPSGSGFVQIANGGLAATGDINLSGVVLIGGGQVVGTRRSGWSTPSGTAARGGFDTASVTTEALAQRVKALIDDLTAHGLIGS